MDSQSTTRTAELLCQVIHNAVEREMSRTAQDCMVHATMVSDDEAVVDSVGNRVSVVKTVPSKAGDRVLVTVVNHRATVVANLTAPNAETVCKYLWEREAPSNCPNCNAVLSYDGGLHCEYCGARFERPEREDAEAVFYTRDGKPYYSTRTGKLTVD